MKIYSFNVNGLRAILKKDFLSWVDSVKPDILCLQETKLSDKDFSIELPGYHQYYSCAQKKGYSGTAIFSRIEPVSVTEGIGVAEHDMEGRTLIAEFDGFYLISVYVPNSQDELKRLDYRQVWDKDFEDFVSRLMATSMSHMRRSISGIRRRTPATLVSPSRRETISRDFFQGDSSIRSDISTPMKSNTPGGHIGSRQERRTSDGESTTL